MKAWPAITRLLVALALLGLALGPSAASSTGPAIVQHEMSAMAKDMPCCPDDGSVHCAKDCPFAISCAPVVVSVPVAETEAFDLPKLLRDRYPNRSDTVVASIAGEPPPRPPRA